MNALKSLNTLFPQQLNTHNMPSGGRTDSLLDKICIGQYSLKNSNAVPKQPVLLLMSSASNETPRSLASLTATQAPEKLNTPSEAIIIDGERFYDAVSELDISELSTHTIETDELNKRFNLSQIQQSANNTTQQFDHLVTSTEQCMKKQSLIKNSDRFIQAHHNVRNNAQEVCTTIINTLTDMFCLEVDYIER